MPQSQYRFVHQSDARSSIGLISSNRGRRLVRGAVVDDNDFIHCQIERLAGEKLVLSVGSGRKQDPKRYYRNPAIMEIVAPEGSGTMMVER